MTSVGLQTQYEAVCENLGLIAYLVQVVVIIIIHINVIIIITRTHAALRMAGLDRIVGPGYSSERLACRLRRSAPNGYCCLNVGTYSFGGYVLGGHSFFYNQILGMARSNCAE